MNENHPTKFLRGPRPGPVKNIHRDRDRDQKVFTGPGRDGTRKK